MTVINPTEIRFEDYIESCLRSTGFVSRGHSEYDRNLCVIRDDVIDFIRETQADSWDQLVERHGIDAKNRVLHRISSEVAKRGIIDVLRHQVIDQGVYLDLCYFQPKSSLAPEHLELYQQNKFTLVRQLHYSNKNNNSIDLVLFLNGLPLVTIELKNQLTGQNIKHSEEQYKNNRDPKEPLLRFKRCVAYFCVDNDKASMATRLAKKDTYFLPYNKDIENPAVEGGYRTDYLWSEIFSPDSLLDILESFVHMSESKNYFYNEKTKKIDSKKSEALIFPRYHQLNLLRKFKQQLVVDGVGTNYLVQHTTGSGKSYSIGWLAHTLTSFYRSEGDTQRMFDTVVVVTDRRVLDQQLRTTIRSLEKTHGVVGGVEQSSKELKEFLEKGKDIVVTTIQKFPFISDQIASLRQKTFAVIIDEVHSSQSGEMSKELKKTLSGTKDEETEYEDILLQEIKNRGKQHHISFFGFTGTPKDKTLELFGTKDGDRFVPFHIYSMRQSIHENFTLDVLRNYITYKRYLNLQNLAEDDDRVVPASRAVRQLLSYVDSHQVTIEKKVSIMLDQWITKGSKGIQNRAKGMIVTRSRKHCVQYFHEVNKQLKDRRIDYRALVAFSGEIDFDGSKFTESALNRDYGHTGDIPLGLKNPKFRLLIIAEKFQTGFDEPLVQTMYVDKPLRGVQCVQTLSRLNRTMPGKTETFVLDFVNEPEVVVEAFQQFYQSTLMEGETDPNMLYDTKAEIKNFDLYTNAEVKRFCEVFLDSLRNDRDLHPILDTVVDRFNSIEEQDTKDSFRSYVKKFIELYGYLSQIISFVDISLEESFIFLKYLIRKLPGRDYERLDITDAVDLDSLRIQLTHEMKEKLEDKEGVFEPPEFEQHSERDPEYDLLSEIIDQVNQTYGVDLTDDDRINLESLNKQMSEDHEVRLVMKSESSDDNKKDFFEKQFNEKLLDYVNDRLGFYKMMNDNPLVKTLICDQMYSDYQKQLVSASGV